MMALSSIIVAWQAKSFFSLAQAAEGPGRNSSDPMAESKCAEEYVLYVRDR
jgi:hypothetical protein